MANCNIVPICITAPCQTGPAIGGFSDVAYYVPLTDVLNIEYNTSNGIRTSVRSINLKAGASFKRIELDSTIVGTQGTSSGAKQGGYTLTVEFPLNYDGESVQAALGQLWNIPALFVLVAKNGQVWVYGTQVSGLRFNTDNADPGRLNTDNNLRTVQFTATQGEPRYEFYPDVPGVPVPTQQEVSEQAQLLIKLLSNCDESSYGFDQGIQVVFGSNVLTIAAGATGEQAVTLYWPDGCNDTASAVITFPSALKLSGEASPLNFSIPATISGQTQTLEFAVALGTPAGDYTVILTVTGCDGNVTTNSFVVRVP